MIAAESRESHRINILEGVYAQCYSKILLAISLWGPMSRQEIASATGLGINQVSGRCAELIDAGSLVKVGTKKSAAGRTVGVLGINPKIEQEEQKKYHLKSIAVGWVDETLMQLWCVEDRSGKQLTDYMSYEGAQSELGKILAKDRSKRGDNNA